VLGVEALVERPDPLPRLACDQHRRGRDAEHLEHPVELALVDLAGLERRVRMSEPVGGASDVAEQSRTIPVHDLRADDADLLDADPDRGLDHPGHGVGVERHPWIDDQHEVRSLRDGTIERVSDRGGEAHPAVVPDHASRAERLEQQVARAVAGRVVDGEDAEPSVGLVGERQEAVTEGRRGSGPDDHDREHTRRRGRGCRSGRGGGYGHADGRRGAARA
jgi:hypothetical protein